MRNRIIIIVLTASIIGGFAYWFSTRFEYREEVVKTGPQGEARTNPYLALERLITKDRDEIHVQHQPLDSNKLPPAGTTLLMPGPRYEVDSPLATRLIDWVRDGGRLVIDVDNSQAAGASAYPLLAKLGVEIKTTEQNAKRTNEEQPTYALDMGDRPPGHIELPNNVWFEYDAAHPVNWAVTDTDGRRLAVALRVGTGEVVAFNDLDFLTNASIGEHDHAYAALNVFAGANQQSLWIVDTLERPSLIQLLRRHAWPALLIAAVLLGAWLIYLGSRLGPIQRSTPPARRSLMEHIQASGRFLWRREQAKVLIEASRSTLLARMRQVQPAWARLPEPDLYRHLAELSELHTEDVQFAFHTRDYHKEAEFTRTIRILQTIGRAL